MDFYFRAKGKPNPGEAAVAPVTEMVKLPANNPVQESAPKQVGYDIAPFFREVIALLPVEALDEMEKCFRGNKSWRQ